MTDGSVTSTMDNLGISFHATLPNRLKINMFKVYSTYGRYILTFIVFFPEKRPPSLTDE